ncbi:hypothetical protein LXA43DRAFT_1095074 [Ganoderma leucocontextum]|nr:hypothetical protein LXA43DRAFT_1095074 [Ganoderma leucocontextum]
MSCGNATCPNHISLLSDKELKDWCGRDDGERVLVASIAVSEAVLHSLLDSDSEFSEVAALEVCRKTPSAPPADCTSSLRSPGPEVRGEASSAFPAECTSVLLSPWRELQTLIGSNDALCHIRSRKLLLVSNLVVHFPISAPVVGAGDMFYQNVVAFKPITLAMELPCMKWDAAADSLRTLSTLELLPRLTKLSVTLYSPADLEHSSGKNLLLGRHSIALNYLPDYVFETLIVPLSTLDSALEFIHVKAAATKGDPFDVYYWLRR